MQYLYQGLRLFNRLPQKTVV